MATAEELLARTATPETEPHIVINNDRTVEVPDELRTIAVQYDHNVETVIFDCPRYWDEHDLSTMKIFINYMRPDREIGQYVAKNVIVDETDDTIMHFSWTIEGHVTEVKGNISFLVCVKSTDENNNLTNRWSSFLNQEMIIREGMDATGAILDAYPDVITSILTQLDELGSDKIELTSDLTVEGKAADAKAVGDAIANINTGAGSTVELDTTLTVEGKAADAKAVGDAIANINAGSGASVELDTTLTVEGKAADAKAVGDKFNTFPVNVSADGYTNIEGIRRATSISTVRDNDTITITATLQGDETHTHVITLDENDYPTKIVSDRVECTFSWDGLTDPLVELWEGGSY